MSDDFNRLRLKHHGDERKLKEILQMECRHKCARKLADTLRCDDFIFPSLSLAEMSTSDAVADVHASMFSPGEHVLDMTAGLGIDSFHIASAGCKVTAIELSHEAADALRHNAVALNQADHMEIIEGDSIEWLSTNDRHFDGIFIDPARRDASGRHFALKQCTPDITASIALLLARARRVVVKLSPMIDISLAKKELGISHCGITVIGTTRECKEVVLTISDKTDTEDDISCITIGHGRYDVTGNPLSSYVTPAVGQYLMQPYPAVMKGTGGRVTGYDKLHPATHLYVSDAPCTDFPGQCYQIIDIIPFNKRAGKEVNEKYAKINVITRNFPISAPELVKKLKVSEGGTQMLFGATLQDGSKVLIITDSPVSATV